MTGFIFRSRLSEDSPVSRNAVKIKIINLSFNHEKSCHTISLECWNSFLSLSLCFNNNNKSKVLYHSRGHHIPSCNEPSSRFPDVPRPMSPEGH